MADSVPKIDFTDRNAMLAYSLGIPLYVDDAGRIWQYGGTGRRLIEPHPNAKPTKHGSPEDDKKDDKE